MTGAFVFLGMLKIRLIQTGKNQEAFIEQAVAFYQQKLKHYCQFETLTLPVLKNAGKLTLEEVCKKEGEQLLKQLSPKSWLVLLDERGKSFDSPEFAAQIEKWTVAGRSQIDFVIGGAFGFSDAVYARADFQLTLSRMTFSHQIIRILFLEQLYRAFTILRNEPYHHA